MVQNCFSLKQNPVFSVWQWRWWWWRRRRRRKRRRIITTWFCKSIKMQNSPSCLRLLDFSKKGNQLSCSEARDGHEAWVMKHALISITHAYICSPPVLVTWHIAKQRKARQGTRDDESFYKPNLIYLVFNISPVFPANYNFKSTHNKIKATIRDKISQHHETHYNM